MNCACKHVILIASSEKQDVMTKESKTKTKTWTTKGRSL